VGSTLVMSKSESSEFAGPYLNLVNRGKEEEKGRIESLSLYRVRPRKGLVILVWEGPPVVTFIEERHETIVHPTI